MALETLQIHEKIPASDLTGLLKAKASGWKKYKKNTFVKLSEQDLALSTLPKALAGALKSTKVGEVSVAVSYKGKTHRF